MNAPFPTLPNTTWSMGLATVISYYIFQCFDFRLT